MTDLSSLLESALLARLPALLADRAELHHRLARRRLPTFLNVPRATCITLRADDTRLTPPPLAPALDDELPPRTVVPARRRAHLLRTGALPPSHTLLITQPLLVQLCAPVSFPHPASVRTIAERLGVTEAAVHRASCPPWAVGYTKRRALFVRTDARGGLGILPHQKSLLAKARALGITNPDSPEAKTLARGRHRLLLSPIHPNTLFDPTARRLGSSTHQAFGPRWLHNPHKLPPTFSQPLHRYRAYAPSPHDSRRHDPLGWRFACPQCARPARILYLPVPLFTLPDYLALDLHQHHPEPLDLLHPPESFACESCHRIDSTPLRNTADSWNRFVSRVTSCLLFGKEVPTPSWFLHPTLKPHPQKHPNPGTRACVRSRIARILRLQQQGLTLRQIAERLHLPVGTVGITYHRYRPPADPAAPTIRQQRAAHRAEQLVRLREQGLPHAEIARRLGITEGTSRQIWYKHNRPHPAPAPTP